MAKGVSENNTEQWAPPVAFYFNVGFHGDSSIPDAAFTEVAGISSEVETEALKEGGENSFVHQLPVKIKHGHLMLKRALYPMDNALEAWVRQNLEAGFSKGFKPLNVTVSLIGANGDPVAQWLCSNAYPVKWEISTLGSEKNELVIETLELNYNLLSRNL